MVLALHISVAMLGLIFAALSYISPSRQKLASTYGFVALTLASGTYLVYSSSGAHLASACFSGLAYLSLVALGLYLSKQKLQKQE